MPEEKEGKKDWVFNIDDQRQGIGRELAAGITTRIVCHLLRQS